MKTPFSRRKRRQARPGSRVTALSLVARAVCATSGGMAYSWRSANRRDDDPLRYGGMARA